MNSLPYKTLLAVLFTSFLALTDPIFAVESKIVLKIPGEILWGFSFLDAENVFITSRSGKLFKADIKKAKVRELSAPKVTVKGQGGLLHPEIIDIKGEKWLYLTYSKDHHGTLTTALSRSLLRKGIPQKFEEIFVAKVTSDTSRHFGSRLSTDGKSLYMSVGDRGERKYAQDLKVHNGKILRLNFDGSPYSTNKSQRLKEIFTWGHRNPQGLFYDKERGLLFSCEFGPRGGDELNIIKEGKNYGWPIITYGREYYGPKIGGTHKEGMEQPLAYWVPSISPSGMTVYRGHQYPQWKGDIFLANLSSTHLRRIKLSNQLRVIEQEVLFEDKGERIRHVSEGPDGYLYYSTDNGLLYRVIKKPIKN